MVDESDSDSDAESWTSDSEWLANNYVRPLAKRPR